MKTSWRHLCKTSWRCLEDVFKRCFENVLKRSWSCLSKTFWRRFCKTFWQNILKTSWKPLEYILNTYYQDEYIGLDQSVFKASCEDKDKSSPKDVFIKTNVCWDTTSVVSKWGTFWPFLSLVILQSLFHMFRVQDNILF